VSGILADDQAQAASRGCVCTQACDEASDKRIGVSGLAIAKHRGVRLGIHGAETLAPKYRAEAKARAEKIAPVIRELQRDGYSMRGIAGELNKRKVETPRGGAWHPQLVKRIVRRLAVEPG
jgi:hypothetical protein